MINLIERIIIEEIHNYFQSANIEYSNNLKFEENLINYFNAKNKFISCTKRKALISKELQFKIEKKELSLTYIEAIKHFIIMFENGENLNGHLSRTIYKSNYYDNLLLNWGIYHLHLNVEKANNNIEMKKNRSDMLLFLIIMQNEVLLLDVEVHKKEYVFSMYNLLVILANNWPELIEEYEVNSNMPRELMRDKEIHLMWKNRMNIGFEINDKSYYFMNHGITGNGSSAHDVVRALKIKKMLNEIVPSPPIYVRNIAFKLEESDWRNFLGNVNWSEGNNNHKIIRI